MKKKGISPLIATVLIIGFTVALAAIIITWSTGFTKKMQEQTEQTANTQVICATDVIFSIESVCKCTSGYIYKVLIQNDGQQEIKSWKVRLYETSSTVDSSPVVAPTPQTLAAFGIQLYTFTPSITIAGVRKVEVFPVIEKGLSKEVTCSQNTDSFGDASSTDFIIVGCSPTC
ncbi:MAG: hypothetical protein Q8O03_05585 [Nanoarchaeota archaeon]|nr:hypothetical protein [Nanoarchaeota archaeon]